MGIKVLLKAMKIFIHNTKTFASSPGIKIKIANEVYQLPSEALQINTLTLYHINCHAVTHTGVHAQKVTCISARAARKREDLPWYNLPHLNSSPEAVPTQPFSGNVATSILSPVV
jgi:hypothetical protein